MLETDYLIIGSGAVGMAFADVILSETEATMIIVDRYAKPGGHWNVAYPFVTLHQPSQFYGVSSKELSKGRKDQTGLNQGLFDLATGAEINAYFEEVMYHTFLPTGRVQYFPMCNYKGNYQFESMLTGEQFEVKVNKKLIDARYLNTSVPSTHKPNFSIDEEVTFMPLNDLVKIKTPPAGFVVIGGGKTGMDACIWLLQNRVNPDQITWIVSRDGWLLDRKNTQPAEEFFESVMGAQAAQNEAIAQAASITDMFDRLEEAGVLIRLDPNVRPQMFHGATVSQQELQQLRRINNVIRKGHVKEIKKDKIILEKGTIPTTPSHIHIDCSASAITNLETCTIFQDQLITLQTVRPYQPIFSAAFIAHIEALFDDDQTKNKYCQVVPLPNHDTDWIRITAAQIANQFTWSRNKEVRNWILHNRLDGFSKLVRNVDKNDQKKMDILVRLRGSAAAALSKLEKFIAELDQEENKDLKYPQFQVRKNLFFKSRLIETPKTDLTIEQGEILVKIDQFAYTANNITYAAAGDMIGYWKFFPPAGEDKDGWGIIPVWGFADVIESNVTEIPVGDRLFGYFQPASHLKMKPSSITPKRFIENSDHRSKLPAGYNVYRRVANEPGYSKSMDRERMLLFPLHLTSFCLWDALKEKDWYGAEQIIILSASSKTSTGLGYALKADKTAPKVIGVTGERNLKTVENLNLYDQCFTYETVDEINTDLPTVIVDMSGNSKIILTLHQKLGDNMKFTSNVGLTHWTDTKPQEGIIAERSKFFFAPGHIQKRLKEWGPAGFDQRTASFMMETAAKTREWLTFKKIEGLSGLATIHTDVCEGKIPANQGLIVNIP